MLMKNMKEYLKDPQFRVTIASVVIGISLFVYNNLAIKLPILNVFSIALVLIGPVTMEYMKYNKMKDVENNLPNFLRDAAGNIDAGMTLPQAITSLKDVDYGDLSPFVKRMIVQIDWGIPFEDVLEEFAEDNSLLVKRTVSTIIETYSGGGNISEVLRSVGNSMNEVNMLRKERYSDIYSQMITGYLIFFIFLGILISLQKFFLPSLTAISSPELGITGTGVITMYTGMFQWLILIQGFFSGLVIGKMAEGNLTAGLKHCLILMLVGYSILTLFI